MKLTRASGNHQRKNRLMAGNIKRMIDRIVEQRAKGNLVIVDTTKAKLIFKGVNPEKFTSTSVDDPRIEAKLRDIAADMGVSI